MINITNLCPHCLLYCVRATNKKNPKKNTGAHHNYLYNSTDHMVTLFSVVPHPTRKLILCYTTDIRSRGELEQKF